MPCSTAIMRIHLSLLMLIVRVFNHGYQDKTTDRDVLLYRFADIHCAIADGELEESSAGACACANHSVSDTRFLARRESVVSVYDLPGAQNLGVDIAIKSRRQIDVY